MDEEQIATMEHDEICDSDLYFGHRDHLDTPENRRMFREGYYRAYKRNPPELEVKPCAPSQRVS